MLLRSRKRTLRTRIRDFVHRYSKKTAHERSRSILMLVIASAFLLAEVAVVIRDARIREALPRSSNVPANVPVIDPEVTPSENTNVNTTPAIDKLVDMEFTGKLCYKRDTPGVQITCTGNLVLTQDGQYILSGTKKKDPLALSEIEELRAIINEGDYSQLRSTTYTGACQEKTADRSEVKYTFYTSHGPEVLEACDYNFDDFLPFVEAINQIQNENSAE